MSGAPRTELFHYLTRAIWALHKARLILKRACAPLANRISILIRGAEWVQEASKDLDDEPTEPGDVH